MSGSSQLKVKILDAEGMRSLTAVKSTVTVGSAAHCDVVLQHPTVQAEHFRAWLDNGRIWIQDLGSEHGTFLNGIRLPILKPMLVRDLDALKLGDLQATLGLEANMVRAPVVRPRPEAEEAAAVAATEKPQAVKDAELEKRRQELAKVSRELAELKLQLQMGRLEKDATEEMRKQISGLRDDLSAMTQQRDRLTESLRRLESEKQPRLRLVDAVQELGRRLQEISRRKFKEWEGRPLTKDMMAQWEKDLLALFRQVLLGESPVAEAPPPVEDITQPRSVSTTTRPIEKKSSKESTSVRKKRPPSFWQGKPWMLPAGGLALVLVVGLVAWRFMPASRARGAMSVMASTSGPLPATTPNPQGAPGMPTGMPMAKSRVFKASYTENVLFTENFVESELNSTWRKRWLADFTKAARADLKLDDRAVAAIANKEQTLVRDLQRLRDTMSPQRQQEQMAAMKAREAVFQKELLALLKNQPQMLDKYKRLKSGFYSRNISMKDVPRH